ncbi:MAG: universal stress protein [Streptosporangiaceae bacterium]
MTKQELAAAIEKENDGAPRAPATGAGPAGGERDDGARGGARPGRLRDATLDALGPQAAQVELRLMRGLAGRALVDAARTLSAQLLVVSSRGEHAMPWLLGSQHVLRNSPCPVLVVPHTG